MPFPPPKKKKGDFALLMAEPEEKPGDPTSDTEPDDDLDDFESDPGSDMGDDMGLDEESPDTEPSIDPEQAALAQKLGFTDPEQQQALLDLIDLRLNASGDMGGTDTGSDLPALPESTY